VIAVHDLRVSFGSKVALDGVNLTVATGEWVGLIGPNGAGKTTLLRAIAQMTPADGKVVVDDQPASTLSQRQLAQLIAFLPQHPVLPPDMTGAEYVLLGRNPHISYFGVESAADRTICLDLLDRLALAHMADRRLATMSGGEAQRLVLARALAQEAPILLLDEPISALDLGRRVEALELIDELRQERSLTVLSAIHDLTLAGQFAERLALLSCGRIAAEGKPQAILRPDLLSAHYGAGIGVVATPEGELVVVTHRTRVP
jgi:iron complex transport system ATP-binding protein